VTRCATRTRICAWPPAITANPPRNACPVCDKTRLSLVHYVYGDALGKSAGQAKARAELARMAATLPEFDVYVVEVCLDCGWNHLVRSYALGAVSA